MFGTAERFGWVECNADHCQGGQSRATTMMKPCRDRVQRFTLAVLISGCHRRCVPEHRPSGPPQLTPRAAQRRTIGVIARWTIEGLRPRRWYAGGLPRCRNSRTGALYREGCPAAPLCGTCRVAGWSFRHNGVPGTPRWGAIPPQVQGRLRHAPVWRHIPAGSEMTPARPGVAPNARAFRDGPSSMSS